MSGVGEELLDHTSPASGLLRADDDHVGALGDDLLQDGLLDEEPPADDVPRAVQPADSLFDGAFQVASGDAAGVLVQINVEDRKIGIPILGDFRRLSQRRLGVRRRRNRTGTTTRVMSLLLHAGINTLSVRIIELRLGPLLHATGAPAIAANCSGSNRMPPTVSTHGSRPSRWARPCERRTMANPD